MLWFVPRCIFPRCNVFSEGVRWNRPAWKRLVPSWDLQVSLLCLPPFEPFYIYIYWRCVWCSCWVIPVSVRLNLASSTLTWSVLGMAVDDWIFHLLPVWAHFCVTYQFASIGSLALNIYLSLLFSNIGHLIVYQLFPFPNYRYYIGL